MDLTELRTQIDEVDSQIVSLFQKRMELVDGVAAYKREHHVPVLASGREEQVLDRVAQLAGPKLAGASRVLFTTLMDLSKSSQYSQNLPADSKLVSCGRGPKRNLSFPRKPRWDARGHGAYSSIAARRMFAQPDLRFYPHFGDVFDAVESGEIEYGVLPIENSSAGSVSAVYDLMKKTQLLHCRGAKASH